MKNENGWALVAVMMILSILTIMGTYSLMRSNTEVSIAGNTYVYWKNFYAADSYCVGMDWLEQQFLDENADFHNHYKDKTWTHEMEMQIGEINDVSLIIKHRTAIDPSDGVEKVLLFGDVDGDLLPEVNFETGWPLESIISTGTTRTRSGHVKIENWVYREELFPMPGAALRVHSNVNGNGVSGSIIGEHKAGSDCDDVPDIMYDVSGGTIAYGGNLGDTPLITQSGGLYPFPIIEPIIRDRATQVIPGSNNIDEGSIITSIDKPGVVYIEGDGKITNLTGYGVLFVNGNFDFAGNLDWNGLILIYGDMVFSGGGTKVIDGAVVAFGEAVAINGSVDIQYDCDYLRELNAIYSRYKREPAWRIVR
jgi:hypothetical protein